MRHIFYLEFNSLSDACQLIVGDCDGKITLLDCDALNINSYLIENKEIEKVIWNPNSVHNFVASTDKGKKGIKVMKIVIS